MSLLTFKISLSQPLPDMTYHGLKDAMADHSWALVSSAALVTLTAAYLQSPSWKLRSIPTIGGSALPLLSYIGARRHLTHVTEWYDEGYARYYGGFFKIPTMDRWMVVATGTQLITEIANMPDDRMSFMDAIKQTRAFDHLGMRALFKDPYHIEMARRDLTRNLVTLLPEVYNEVAEAFRDYVPMTDGWTAMPAFKVSTLIVARASNRIIVGLPFCRNEEYLKRCIMYTKDIYDSGYAINRYPWYLKPLVAPFLNKLPVTERAVTEFLRPEIDRRMALMKECGKEYPDKPNDFLQWMLDHTFGGPDFNDVETLIKRIMSINFTAIHTSSATFTHCLFTIATHPEWIPPLREEIQRVFKEDGLSKAALQKMIKLDSVFRECSRTNALFGHVLTRVAYKPHTFSDGTYIPAGTFVTVPSSPHQLDERNYDNPSETQPFRFENVEDDTTRKYFTTSDPKYIAFGLGKHACPGRFFAGNELKLMMAHLILNYDIKTEKEGIRPQNMYIAGTNMPDVTASIMIRKRRD